MALHKVNHQITLKCRNNSQFSSFQWRRSVVGDRTLADCKVLIVDDQASSRLVLETLLEDTVACASVGSDKEAIEYCKYHTPDLILMDVSIPELDGHQTTALLRKKHRVIPQNLRPRHYNLHCLALDANAVLPA